MIKKNIQHNKNGQTLIMISVFIAVFTIMSVGIVSYVIGTSRAGNILVHRAEANYFAEAGAAKAVWCLNHSINADCGGTAGINYPGESNISYGGGTFTTTVTTSGQTKIIVATGQTADGTAKTIRVEANAQPDTTDVSFSFSTYIGNGGISMNNNSLIVGTGGTFGSVYSNGSILCGGNASISGTVKVAGNGNKIYGCDVGYDGFGVLVNNLADAWAHTLLNCRVAHDIYHPTNGNLSSCTYGNGSMGGTLYNNATLPPLVTFPITNPMITDWETAAAAGGTISGNYTPPNGTTIGPTKITGNLTLNNNVTVNVAGTVWVEGNITLNNGSKLQLISSFGPNSGIVIADKPSDQAGSGLITLNNNSIIAGSGTSGSYLMLISTKSSGTAIDVNNNSQGAVYIAVNGTVKINNNATLKEVVAYRLEMNNNAVLTYESGLIDANFANSPGGSWKVKRETWQEL